MFATLCFDISTWQIVPRGVFATLYFDRSVKLYQREIVFDTLTLNKKCTCKMIGRCHTKYHKSQLSLMCCTAVLDTLQMVFWVLVVPQRAY